MADDEGRATCGPALVVPSVPARPSRENVDLHAPEVSSDPIAFAMPTFAYSTQLVDGVPGKKVPGPMVTLPEPRAPLPVSRSSAGRTP